MKLIRINQRVINLDNVTYAQFYEYGELKLYDAGDTAYTLTGNEAEAVWFYLTENSTPVSVVVKAVPA